MDKITEFKKFVKNNPSLINYVKDKQMTWQSFYEMYDMYGEDESVWKSYLTKKETKDVVTSIGVADFFTWLKNINVDKMQESINSIQRVLGVLEDLGKDNVNTKKTEYKPRPLYKHFED